MVFSVIHPFLDILLDQDSHTIEAHYAWLESTLGKDKLAQLYALLDDLIELEQP